jgi:dTDP-4-amino-4,6-dideoxygalactose transaminase
MRRIRSHGEVARYRTAELGFNYRLTDLQAAIARSQLDRLPELTRRRRENARYLNEHLRGVLLPPEPTETEAMVWHQYTIRVPEGRDALVQWLRGREIEASVYYPEVVPAQPLYRDLGYDTAGLPVAQQLAREVVSLPVHPGLSDADLDQIVAAVNEWTAKQGTGTLATEAGHERR